MQPHALGHQAGAPVRSARRLLLERAAHDLGLDFGRDRTSRPTGAGPILKSRETFVVVPVQPSLHGRQRNADLAGQGPAWQTSGRTQDDPGALLAPLRGRAGSNPSLELLAVPGSQVRLRCPTAGELSTPESRGRRQQSIRPLPSQ